MLKKYPFLLHIYNRGNHFEEIGRDLQDYNFLYEEFLKRFCSNNFDVISLAIMPNHYHLLVKQCGNKSLSIVMQLLAQKYTRYFNHKYSMAGHLFQGTYKYKKVYTKNQFYIVYNYIQKNPLEINYPAQKPWLYRNEMLFQYYLLNFQDEKPIKC